MILLFAAHGFHIVGDMYTTNARCMWPTHQQRTFGVSSARLILEMRVLRIRVRVVCIQTRVVCDHRVLYVSKRAFSVLNACFIYRNTCSVELCV